LAVAGGCFGARAGFIAMRAGRIAPFALAFARRRIAFGAAFFLSIKGQ
jgi:hypothetical protein